MWLNHPFSRRNKATERAVGLGVVSNRERGFDKFEEKG